MVRSNSEGADVEKVKHRMDEQFHDVRSIVNQLIEDFTSAADSNSRYFIAERLPALGTLIIPRMRQILENSETSSDLRYLAAWASLRAGDRAESVAVLIGEIGKNSEWSVPAANALATHGIEAAAGPIARALEDVDLTDEESILAYGQALKSLGGSISEDSLTRLSSQVRPWIARVLVEDFGRPPAVPMSR